MNTPHPPPSISVVIPCYNCADLIGAQLESLCAQVNCPDFEVVIADNRSTDDLEAAVAPFRDRLDVRIVPATGRQTVSHARNVGVDYARGEVIVIVDADDACYPHLLERLYPSASLPGVIATCRTTCDELPAACTGSPLTVEMEAELEGENCEPIVQSAVPPELVSPSQHPLPYLHGYCMALRRSEYWRIGGCDESFRGGCDDFEFGFRAVRMGFDLHITSAAIFYRMRSTPEHRYKQYRNYKRADIQLSTRHPTYRFLRPNWDRYSTFGRNILRNFAYYLARRGPHPRQGNPEEMGIFFGWTRGYIEYVLLRKLLRKDPGPMLYTPQVTLSHKNPPEEESQAAHGTE